MSEQLLQLLRRKVEADGPIRQDEWWQICLYHPGHGYYATKIPLGADFITAPDISQLFGELIGLALAQCWLDGGAKQPATLAEIGPGKGTLMADAWRALGVVPNAREALAPLALVEVSASLRAFQTNRLRGLPVRWFDALDQVPMAGPTYLVANELFDALPVRQLVRLSGRWFERKVGVSGSGHLGLLLDPRPSPLTSSLPDSPDGAVHEISPARERMAASVGQRLVASGGAALLIDYGEMYDGATGDTIQAVRGHRKVSDPFELPGEIDLTSRVDFNPIVRALQAAGCTVAGPITQGEFLRNLGIEVRTEALANGLDAAQAADLRNRTNRLIDPRRMGRLFKVLGVAPAGQPLPPGFPAEERPA
ncbi:MAG TPA: SAM-dependent methyltransferase [Geminicoccus sp.]|jgi:NADH dehydrogenase [ubiquinone] 1 alpha subcomplex assembly factor 7|uniref:class I SAM-dependent methyltransferase n=1 Tax=Geminicoccus sp. TaxID=2024832 RepID=UPI002E2F8716|nr:SAM-dependent methyltransferase [Geminicoccus sp.]HEX2528747.1 SAM-dependent methyltransferase [Geminicoccus sp.]